MKKLKRILTVLTFSMFFVSCEDAINITQDGELTDEVAFQTVADLKLYLNGAVYSSVDVTNEIVFTSIFTDEVGIGPSNGGQAIELHRFVLNASNGYASSIWATHYSTINKVNRLIKAANTYVTPTAAELPTYNSYLAEAKALRAHAYLQLLTYFSTDMSNDAELGVILSDHVPDLNEKLPRSTNAEIFELIESDLQYAEDNLINPTGANAFKFVSTNLVNAIRARMYLYRKDYVNAKIYAQKVITDSGLVLTAATPYSAANFYSATASTNPYRKMWADYAAGGQGEIIFSLSRPTSGSWGNIASNYFFNTTQLTGGAYLDMGMNLFNELSTVNGDIRALNSVDPSSSATVKIIDKYPGKGSTPLRNDLKVFRLSEMYFILAECAVEDGDLTGAAGYIKSIRDKRNRLGAQPLPVYTTENQALADILLERRKEFCFEGYRYIDIKRLGVLAGKSIERNVADDEIATLPLTISNTDYRFTLPIPQAELSANPNIQQNPNY